MLKKIIFNDFWSHFLFWSWNAIFLAFVFLGFTPFVIVALVQAVIDGWVPATFLFFGMVLVAIPVLAVALGFIKLRGTPDKLFAFGYGVEAPLMLLILIRFFALREVTTALAVLLIFAAVGMGALLWQLLDSKIDQRGRVPTALRLIGLSLLLFIGIYVALWAAFYTVPVIAGLFQLIKSAIIAIPNIFLRSANALTAIAEIIYGFLYLFLGSTLLLISGALFAVFPIAIPIIYLRNFMQAVRAAQQKFNGTFAFALPAGMIAACFVAVLVTNQQPQKQAFDLLQKPPATLQEATNLLQHQEQIRAGLLNAYLAPYRYVSANREVTHVGEMYEWALDIDKGTAQPVQNAYEFLLSPLLYSPAQSTYAVPARAWQSTTMTEDSDKAKALYEQFFDQPINKAERNTVVNSVRSNWNVDQATQAWQAVDDREILLTQQAITLTEREGGMFADLELYEVYQNQTNTRQEVVYYFNMPESAVLTGVWLGNSPDRDKRFVYTVAPRGAAQQVYKEQVRINRDPALLEQIGPRQYRLRVFPIEPPQFRWSESARTSTRQAAPQMYLWLTWRVLPFNGMWLLPKLSEKRNVYWTNKSVRTFNGQTMQTENDAWLPESVRVNTSIQPKANRVNFANDTSVAAMPIQEFTPNNALPTSPEHLKNPLVLKNVAVVLDRSRSMASQHSQVVSAFAQLQQWLGTAGAVDVYLTAAQTRGEAASVAPISDVDVNKMVYFGGQDTGELLLQFNELSKGKRYDAVLVLTDEGSYELNKDRKIAVPNSPVWFVHLGSGLPLGYDDALLQAIQASGGGIDTSLGDVFIRISIQHSFAQENIIADVSGDTVWLAAPSAKLDDILNGREQVFDAKHPFASFATRRLILAEMQRNKGTLAQNETLDYLNKIAVEQSIVTPYSSMIVLVNDEQQKRLDELSKQGDRFDREKETVGETPPVTGVPEPHEWLLMGIAAAFLGWYVWKRRQTALA